MRGQDIHGVTSLGRRCAKAIPLVAVLVLGLALAGCDRCGDFFWHKNGACHATPAPH